MARKSLWVGLDVGADQTTVCATDDSRAVLYEVPIAKNPAALHAVLKRDKRRISLIGLESGSFAIVLYRYLVKLGYIVDLDRRLAQRAKEDPVCQRFLEIPGVGPITALAFYSAVDDPYRFRRSTDIGAYFGLVPRVRQSDQRLTRTRITKSGDRLTRTYLTSAAQHHLRTADSSLTRWGTALSERLRKPGVHVALARKLAVTMLAIWKSGAHFDPYHGASAARLEAGSNHGL